jgi:hypothetical protein
MLSVWRGQEDEINLDRSSLVFARERKRRMRSLLAYSPQEAKEA